MEKYKSPALITVLSALILFFIFSSDAPSVIPPHLALARELEAHVLPADNSYRHFPSTVELAGRRGATKYACHTDCSGLVAALFRYGYGYTKKELRHWLKRPSGNSISFFEAVSHDRGFTRIGRVQDILPGDILTYKLPPGASDYGHVMIANGSPVKLEGTHNGLLRWKVPIIDCTGKGHGIDDSRYLGNGRFHSGIGKGNFCIYSDLEGNIAGCGWSPMADARFFSIQVRPFVVGRLIPGYH